MTLYFYICLIVLSIIDAKYKQVRFYELIILLPPFLFHFVIVFLYFYQCISEGIKVSLMELIGYDLLVIILFVAIGLMLRMQVGNGDLIFLMLVSPIIGYERVMTALMIGFIGVLVAGVFIFLKEGLGGGDPKKLLRVKLAFIPFMVIGIGVVEFI